MPSSKSEEAAFCARRYFGGQKTAVAAVENALDLLILSSKKTSTRSQFSAGIRTVIPQKFLALLQDILGHNLILQDYFEQAFGTSPGSFSFRGLLV